MAKRRRFDLKKSLFLLPNMITLSSIFCGFDSMRISASAPAAGSEQDYYLAALLIVFAMFFDMLDGRVARATKTQSAFGLQIDSLADVISFGAAPAMLVYNWTLRRLDVGHPVPIGLIVSFVYVACAAIRLARFNVIAMGEQKPSKNFIGLPTPGGAGILVSIVVANHAASGALGGVEYVWPLLVITLGLSFLMVSNVRFRTFKDVKLNARSVLFVLYAVGSSAVISYQTKPQFVLVWLLGCYVLVGIFESLWQLPGRLRARALAQGTEGGPVPPGRPSKPPPA